MTDHKGFKDASNIINLMFQETFGKTAYEHQVEAVFLVAFLGLTTLLVSGTSTGKTAIMHSIALLLGGVTIVVVPLKGLGSQQKIRANSAHPRILSFHLDNIKKDDRPKIIKLFKKETSKAQHRHLSFTTNTRSTLLEKTPRTLDKEEDAHLRRNRRSPHRAE